MTVEEYRDRIMLEKKTAALEAASACFLKDGYDRTTLAEVARVAGISTGTLFKHFPTKAVLFGAIMERMWEADPSVNVALPPTGAPVTGLTQIGMDYAAKLRQPTTEPFFRVIIAEAQRFPELAQALFERGKVPYLKRLDAYIESEIAAGTLEVEDVSLAGRQFLGMINDVIFWPRFLDATIVIPDPEVKRVVHEAVLTIVARYGRQA
ncbi:TetR/AcrR family transcriptional regulator [Oryzifoliimicrobium ureilyticus]|uniref:TetR/AcrR family transcriptional regulator n=1 Tax=Oryzifoliimicrobium ureilyticus TaxID=3113724 RepID=UPI0030760D97